MRRSLAWVLLAAITTIGQAQPQIRILDSGGGPGKYANRVPSRSSTLVTPEQAAAIKLGLAWLREHQDESGMWDADGFMKHDREGVPSDGPGSATHDVGVTALAVLAFLGDGNHLRAGPHRNAVTEAVGWLRQQQGDDGRFGTDTAPDFIYDHTLATLAMVEAYGMSESVLLRRYAQAGLDYLEAHRNPESVWRYQPRDQDNDTSVTGWAVMAYVAAKDFSLRVNETGLLNAIEWLDVVTNDSGRVGYTAPGEPASRRPGDHASRFPPQRVENLTAVGLLCRYFVGQRPRTSPFMNTAADAILRQPPVWDERIGTIDFGYWYHASYALFQTGGSHWRIWSLKLNEAVLGTQRQDGSFRGSWDPVGVWGEDGGRVYSTAMLVLTLEASYRYVRLPR